MSRLRVRDCVLGTFIVGTALMACIDTPAPPMGVEADGGPVPGEADAASGVDATVPVGDAGDMDSGGPNTSDAGDAGLVCQGPLTACGGACVDVQTSDDHCGRCDRSCGGAGCTKGACKPTDLLTGLTFPTSIVTNPLVSQIFVNVEGRVVRCAKAGCGNSPTGLWDPTRYKTNEASPIALTAKMMVTLVYDTANQNEAQRFLPLLQTLAAPKPDPTTYTPVNSLLDLAGDPTSTDVAAQAAYAIYACPGGYCAKESSDVVKYTGDEGETNVAIQPGTPGYYAWPGYSNIRLCERGLKQPCSSKGLVTNELKRQPSNLVVTATTAYWIVPEANGYSVQSCPFPAGCPEPRVLVQGEGVINGFAADDKGVYWTDRNGGLLRACEDLTKGCGTAPKTLLSNLAQPYAIALDDQAIYFTQRAGQASQGRVTRLVR